MRGAESTAEPRGGAGRWDESWDESERSARASEPTDKGIVLADLLDAALAQWMTLHAMASAIAGTRRSGRSPASDASVPSLSLSVSAARRIDVASRIARGSRRARPLHGLPIPKRRNVDGARRPCAEMACLAQRHACDAQRVQVSRRQWPTLTEQASRSYSAPLGDARGPQASPASTT